ncbi:hypothetical protein RUND412_001570 [Rhizina undulata]
MSQSPPASPPKPKSKKPFMFKKPNLSAKPKTDTDDLAFFSRSKLESDAVLKAAEERLQLQVQRKAKAAAISSPKRRKTSSELEGDDDEEEAGGGNSHRSALRQRYAAIAISDSDEPSDVDRRPHKTDRHLHKSSRKPARPRERSLTPPPQLYNPPVRQPPAPVPVPAPIISLKSEPEPEPELVPLPVTKPTNAAGQDPEDDFFATLATRARARAAAVSPTDSSGPDPIVSILVTSPIPNAAPLIVRRRLTQKLKEVRLAYCRRQGFAKEQMEDIFLLWKGIKVYDYNSCAGLGVRVDATGELESWQEGLSEGNVHFEAVTTEILARMEREKDKAQEEGEMEVEKEGEKEEGKTIRLILRGKGIEDFKIKVRPETKISKLIAAFRAAKSIPNNVTLDFDGETLEPDDTVGDTELEDMFTIDVHLSPH